MCWEGGEEDKGSEEKKKHLPKKEEKTFLFPNRTISERTICALSWTLRLSDPGKSPHISKTIYSIIDYPGTAYNFVGTY